MERHFFFPKATWRDKIWKKGWDLEDTYWRTESQLHRSLDLLSNTYPCSIYLAWWSISDKYPMLMKKCEILSKIVCHASLLRVDDFSLKDQLNTFKMFDLCDNFEIEDARHIVLHCPFFQYERDLMFNEIQRYDAHILPALNGCNVDMLYILLGRNIHGLTDVQMEQI